MKAKYARQIRQGLVEARLLLRIERNNPGLAQDLFRSFYGELGHGRDYRNALARVWIRGKL